MIFFKSKRIKDLEQRVGRLEAAVVTKLSAAVDQKYEFSEILECLDDMMLYIDNHP